jgi:hypothetical protein
VKEAGSNQGQHQRKPSGNPINRDARAYLFQMRGCTMRHGSRINPFTAGLTLASLLALSEQSFAQGCEPIRFSNPSLGAQGESYQEAHQWRLTVGYRRLYTNQWTVGTEVHNDSAPFGSAPIISIHTFVASLAYAVTNRFNLQLSLPFSTGSLSRVYPDSASHRESTSGVGDVSLVANLWMLDPGAPGEHRKGNIALGLGVKAPTGSNHVASKFYTASGPVPFAADQAIELGDGGWGIILETQAFRQVFDRAFVYLSGSYMFSPRAQTDVATTPTSGLFWSVPDIYSGRVGLAYTLLPDQGLSASLGGRIDGDPVQDVLGGGDSAYRRPGYVIYLDPGFALTRGRDNITLSVPLRLHAERQRSVLEQQSTQPVGGGFAKFLIFAAYSRRF